MKGLTLTPPWGTLIAFGEKQVETRSWPTRYRGLLAIHQAKGAGPIGGETGIWLTLEREPFKSVLRPHLSGYTTDERLRDLPRGAIVATVSLAACIPTQGTLERTLEASRAELHQLGLNAPGWVTKHEEAFGDYSPGRYAWLLERRINLHDGIECRGGRSLWDVPDDVVAQLGEIVDVDE